MSLKLDILNLTENKANICTSLYVGAEWLHSNGMNCPFSLRSCIGLRQGLMGGGHKIGQGREETNNGNLAIVLPNLKLPIYSSRLLSYNQIWVKSFTEIISFLTAIFLLINRVEMRKWKFRNLQSFKFTQLKVKI